MADKARAEAEARLKANEKWPLNSLTTEARQALAAEEASKAKKGSK
jgi:hypothetical protein